MIHQGVFGAIASSQPVVLGGIGAAGQVYTVSYSPSAFDIPTYTGLTDGTTSGAASIAQSSSGEFLKATFAQPVIVTNVTLGGGFCPNFGANAANFCNGRNVQYSTDNSTWTTAFVVSGVTDGGLTTFTLSPAITAQYWRIALDGPAYVATTEFSFT